MKGNIHRQEQKGVTKQEKLSPGQLVFTDQYVSSLPGNNFTKRGQTLSNQQFKGSTIFCDAASGFMYVQNQVGFTAAETVEAKLKFEREAASVGIKIQSYMSDNGVFTSKDFVHELDQAAQTIRHRGVGGHHHNGPAENASKNVTR